jgi:multidrug efflux pump subunit AcrB
MDEMARAFPPGVRWENPFDTTPFISESIREVAVTLAEAMALVTLVVFVFLQSWRATLIPVLAVPVSILGTFLGLQALGFTINTLTLFGMVLAIGIVVDDAIVVIENVERIMAADGVSARVATNRAMRQISGALIAIVLVLCSVFIPVAFVPGITGAMYKQFAVTIVISVVLSGMVALTLTPALCAMLLKEAPHAGEGAPGREGARARGCSPVLPPVQRRVRPADQRLRPGAGAGGGTPARVVRGVRRVGRAHRRAVPPRAGRLRAHRGQGVLRDQRAAARRGVAPAHDGGGAADRTDREGRAGGRGRGRDRRARPAHPVQPDQHRDHVRPAQALGRAGRVRERGRRRARPRQRQDRGIKEAIGFGFNFPEIPGLGTTAGLEMNLQQRSGDDIAAFGGLVQQFVADANTTATQGANGGVRTDVPQLFVTVDEDAARARGVGTAQVFATLQTMLSSLYINDFTLYGRPYRVQAEAQQGFRQRPEDVGRFHVRSAAGAMIPVSALVTTEMRSAPSLLTRFNGFPSATITGTPRPGRSSGQMLDAVEKLIDDKYAAQGVGFAYSGESYQERAAGGQSATVLGLALVLVFLVLAAQYESWTVPFAVLLGVPFGLLGAIVAVWLRGMPNDVYFQVGLFAVIGLAAKNAVLIVEFATELVARGATVRDAALQAARERFRPILMTSLAFILGVAPLVFASGAGAGSRHSLGTSVFFGMLGATALGIFFIPLFYVTIRTLATRRAARPAAPPAAPIPAAVAGD